MAKTILQQLFDGEIYPSQTINPNNPRYNEAKKALAEEIDCFLKPLSKDEGEHFQKITDLYYEMAGIYNYECFAHGCRLGVKLVIESMNDANAKTELNEKDTLQG